MTSSSVFVTETGPSDKEQEKEMMNLSRFKLLLELKARRTERPSFSAVMSDAISVPDRMAEVVPGAQEGILGKFGVMSVNSDTIH